MYLLVAATQMEVDSLVDLARPIGDHCLFLVSGVGPVETAISLCRFLDKKTAQISAVINFGLAGAYQNSKIGLLDICLAKQESFGDFGISYPDRIEPLDESFAPETIFKLDRRMRMNAVETLNIQGIDCTSGNFVTVAAASATERRGNFLRDKFDGICENMEGGAVARVCSEFAIPCLEIRCVSNLVIDRHMQEWRTEEALEKCGAAVNALLKGVSLV